jgi:hypothetical protein
MIAVPITSSLGQFVRLRGFQRFQLLEDQEDAVELLIRQRDAAVMRPEQSFDICEETLFPGA